MEMLTRSQSPDFTLIKSRQQAAWALGDLGRIGVTQQIVGEWLCEAADVRPTDTVLDVAAGNGNAALAAARRFADVTATDYVPDLLADAARRAEADRLALLTRVADAEDLPFAPASFDVALSTFGVMFAPDQRRAASELLRVVRPGGRIGLASWTPEGFFGELFRLVARFSPHAPGLASPLLWGTHARLADLFGARAVRIRTRHRTFALRYLSAMHWIEAFRRDYGPLRAAFASLDPTRREALYEALRRLLARFDRGGGESLVVPAEYLEAVIQRA